MTRPPPLPTESGDIPSSWTRQTIGVARAEAILDLATLETALRQGHPIGAIPIYVTVSCGRPSLTIEDTTFSLATWQVLVRIELENAKIKFGSVPSIRVLDGSFETESSAKTTWLTIEEHALALELGSGARALPKAASVTGSLLGKLNWKKSKKLSDTATSTTKTRPEIILIGQYGSAIAIGDENYGDPHKPYGLLGHNYPKEQGDEIVPLFTLEPVDPSKPMRVTMMTTIPFRKLCLLSTEINQRRKKLMLDEIEQLSNEAIENYEILRKQMLRDELARRMSQNQRKAGVLIGDNEFAVMIEVFEIRSE